MPVTIYPGTLKKRNSDGTYSDLVPAVNTGGSAGSDNNIADDYRPTTTYAMGDHVLYSGVLYRCISASGATGTWDSTKWDAVTVGEEIENIEGAIDDLESDLLSNFAANYNASASYTIGKYCIHDGQLYRCIVAIPSPGEAWNSSHWATTNISNQVYNTIIKISNQYNPARTYKKDEVCIYGDALKYCKIDMTGPEAWNFSHWGTVTGVMDVVGSGQLDSSFEADNLTGAANELKNTLNQLDTEVDTVENGLAIPQTGNTCTKTGGIPKGAFIFLQGHSTLTDGIYQNTSGSIIANGATFTSSNLTRCYQETGTLNLLNSGLMATAKVYRRNLASSSNLNVVFYPTDVACMVITSGSVKSGYGTATIVTGYVTGSRLSHTDLKSESTLGYDFTSTTECKFAIINNATNSGIQVTVLDFLGTFKEWSGGTPSEY